MGLGFHWARAMKRGPSYIGDLEQKGCGGASSRYIKTNARVILLLVYTNTKQQRQREVLGPTLLTPTTTTPTLTKVTQHSNIPSTKDNEDKVEVEQQVTGINRA